MRHDAAAVWVTVAVGVVYEPVSLPRSTLRCTHVRNVLMLRQMGAELCGVTVDRVCACV